MGNNCSFTHMTKAGARRAGHNVPPDEANPAINARPATPARITPALINATRKVHFGSEHGEIIEFIKFPAISFGGPSVPGGLFGNVSKDELFYQPEFAGSEGMLNTIRQIFPKEDVPPEVAEAMAQLRGKLWSQLLLGEETMINGRGEFTSGTKCWRYQTVLADVEPSTSPEYQESVASNEVTVASILKKEVAAIVLQDASEKIAASLRYKQDIQGDLPSLPDGLWLMDTGCGVDLITGQAPAT